MVNDLQKFLDAKKKPTRLLGDVERYMLLRPQGDRSTLVLHPSEIIKPDFCHRYSYYLMSGGVKLGSKPALKLQSIFDEGHYIHDKWQTYFYEMGNLYGDFKCVYCKGITTGISPESCSSCGGALKYDEVKMLDKKLRIAGHTDGWIKGIGEDCLIEIKSIGTGTMRFDAPELLADADNDVSKAFKNIRRPFRSHLLQGQMYLELAKRMYGSDAPNEIVFIYELKADQSYKEFSVKADFEMVERIFWVAEKIVEAVEDGRMPKCNIDPENGCKECNLIP